jgi:hypothetical protein
MKLHITAREKYDPAMRITTQEEADAYFEECVEHQLAMHEGMPRSRAEDVERQNIGYWSGYGKLETRARVEHLFKCRHPILPPVNEPQPDPAQLMQIGFDWARANKPITWPRRSEPFE